MKNFLLKNRQFLVYCAIAGCSTVFSSITFTLLLHFAGLHYQAANAIAYAVGSTLSYILNARYNFRVNDSHLPRFLCFFCVALAGWFLSAIVLRLLIEKFGWNAYAAYFAGLTVAMILQYNLNRLISFRKAR